MEDVRPVTTDPTAPTEPSLRQLLGLLREDRSANLNEWTYPGFQALLAYRLGGFSRAIRVGTARRIVGRIHERLAKRAVRRYGIELHPDAWIGRRVRIIHQNGIVVHAGAVVGDDCWIRQGAQVGSRLAAGSGPVLGQDVRLGVNAFVASAGVVIGDGVRVGPNCVVTSSIPEGASTMPTRVRKISR